MRTRTQVVYEAVERTVDAVADASGLTRDAIRDSGALVRMLGGAVVEGGQVAIVTGIEIIHRRCIPTLDERMLATALGLRVTRSDTDVLRLERSAELPR